MFYTIISFPFLMLIKFIDGTFSSEIVKDKLFLSSFPILKSELDDLKNKGITLSINFSSELYEGKYKKDFYKKNGIKTKIFKIKDGTAVNEDILKEAYELMKNEIDNGGKVNVNCALGHSRSYSLILYYLCKEEGFSLNEAEDYVKEKRKGVNLNKKQRKSLSSHSLKNSRI